MQLNRITNVEVRMSATLLAIYLLCVRAYSQQNYSCHLSVLATHRNVPIDRENIEIYSGDLNKLVNERLKPNYKNVWLVGGAMLAKDFIRLKLADEIRLSVMPIILGEGILFLEHVGQEQALHLKDVTAYKSGMVELRYEIRKDA